MGSESTGFIKNYHSCPAYTDKENSGCKSPYLPARYVLVGLFFVGICLSYVFRTNMSLTIVAMVNKTKSSNCTGMDDTYSCDNTTISVMSESRCPMPKINNGTEDSGNDFIQGPYTWSPEVQGVILGSFYYGYACTQIIMGKLADQLGPKWLIGIGMFLGSVFTLLVPIAADWGAVALITLRVLTGMTQGVLYPGLAAMFVRWLPEAERSLMYCICSCGATLGIILSMPVVAWLCRQDFLGGWPAVFYVFGGIGCIWSLLWLLMSSNDPSTHPRISEKEKRYILKSLPEHGMDPKEQESTPWKSMLTSGPMWAYIFTFSCSTWVYYTRLTELPNYFDQILHSPIQQNGWVNAFVNAVSVFFSLLSGYVADKMLIKNFTSKTNVRKIMECTALFGSSACLLGVVISGCNFTAVVAFLTLASGFLAVSNSGDSVLNMDLAPALSGTVFGIANTFCSITGFVSPLVTGFVLGSKTIDLTTQWEIVFYMSSALGIAGGLVAIFWWSADVQPWDPTFNQRIDEEMIPYQEEEDDDEQQSLITKANPMENS